MRLRSLGLGLAIAGGTVVVLPTPATGAPPVLISASHEDGHPKATWSIPPGVDEMGVVEVATAPQRGSDGYFFSENVEIFDLLEERQVSYLSSEALFPGTYYLHVSSYDWDCDYCPTPEWSETRAITIPNRSPEITKSEFEIYGGQLEVDLTVCDEGGDDLRIYLEALKVANGRVIARRSSKDTSYAISNYCDSHWAYVNLSRRFYEVGRIKARAWVMDPYGASSRVVTDSWRIRPIVGDI
jgi:hypothetical protein